MNAHMVDHIARNPVKPTDEIKNKLDYVNSILEKFYTSPSKENQDSYERLLISDVAWNLCPLMLDPKETHPNVQFFGASVLFSRIARLSHTISFEERVSLRSTLISYISIYAFDENADADADISGKIPPRHVYIRLCIALIRLAMTMNVDNQWPDPIVDLCTILATQTSLNPVIAHQTVCRLLGLFAEEIKAQQQSSALNDDGHGAGHKLAQSGAS